MGNGLFQLASIYIGRFVFALIGAVVRYFWFYLARKPRPFSKIWRSDKDEIIDSEDYKNRMIGIFFSMGLIILFIDLMRS